jgi:predicted aspartyl protease
MILKKIKPLRANNKEVLEHLYSKAKQTIPRMLEHIVTKIFINGYIDNKPINILLDTGATTSIIDYKLLERLDRLEEIDYRTISTIGGFNGDIEYSLGYIPYLEIGLNSRTNQGPIATTVANISIKNTKVDLLLGLNFLISYNAKIDIENKKLYINKLEVTFSLN